MPIRPRLIRYKLPGSGIGDAVVRVAVKDSGVLVHVPVRVMALPNLISMKNGSPVTMVVILGKVMV